MIHGIGVDIVAISRFQTFLDTNNQALLNRLFCDHELEMCKARKDTASCLAARFAAKEAFLKALGTGLRNGISWQDITIHNNGLGKPELKFSNKAQEFCMEHTISTSFLSISHDGGNAIAMVVLES